MKKLIFLMFIFILFIHCSAQTRAGIFGCCCGGDPSDDAPHSSSHTAPQPPRDTDRLLGGQSAPPPFSASSALVSYTPLNLSGDTELSIPSSFTVQNKPGGVVAISSKIVGFYLYPTHLAAATTAEYAEITRSKATLVSDPETFPSQVRKVYTVIRELGTREEQTEQAEQFVRLIQQMVEKFPVTDKKNIYRLARSTDKKKWRLCLQIVDERVVMILVPGTTE